MQNTVTYIASVGLSVSASLGVETRGRPSHLGAQQQCEDFFSRPGVLYN